MFCDCTDWFVLDLVGNPNCWVSHAQAHFFGSKWIQNKINIIFAALYFLFHITTYYEQTNNAVINICKRDKMAMNNISLNV